MNPPFQTARNFWPLQFHHIHGKRTAAVEQQNHLPVAFAYYWLKSRIQAEQVALNYGMTLVRSVK